MNGRLTLCGMVGAFVLLSGLGCPVAVAAPGELPSDQAYKNDKLPPSVVKALNVPKRVYGFLSRGDEFDVTVRDELYFKGDTKQLNALLESLAPLSKVKDSKLTARIVPGPGRTEKLGNFMEYEEKEFAFNWSVKIEQVIGYDLVEHKPQAKDGEPESSFGLEETDAVWKVEVKIHLDGDIDLAKVRLPLEYDASAGGRVADFVELHNRRVKAYAGVSEGIFGGPDTRPTSDEIAREHGHRGDLENTPSAFLPAKDLPAALGQLVKLNQVQSDVISDGDIRSPYSKIARVFLAKGTDEYFQKMIRCDNVVVRVMAMDCIFEKQGAKSLPLLKSRLSSRARPRSLMGCIGDVTTEGAYARDILMNADAPQSTATQPAAAK